MESNLFMDLSDEQQELVAGGGQLQTADISKYADYFAVAELSSTDIANVTTAGPNGSANVFAVSNDFAFAVVDTSAYDDVSLSFSAPFGGNDD